MSEGTEPTTMPSLEAAIALAAGAHEGQLYQALEPEPYILHPLRVMLRLEDATDRLVAVLHDVVEDTDHTLDDMRREGYPDEVIEALDQLTRRDGEPYEHYIERLASHSRARRVKLADLAENLANNHRLPQTKATRDRVARYEAARDRLLAMREPTV